MGLFNFFRNTAYNYNFHLFYHLSTVTADTTDIFCICVTVGGAMEEIKQSHLFSPYSIASICSFGL